MGVCDPGLHHESTLKVEPEHTAVAMGSGDVPVLSTPAVLALAERAAVAAVRDELPEGQTSVGSYAEVEHEVPTAVGATVCADATLLGHHGRRLEFQIVIRDGDTVVARVRHRRVLLDRDRFLEKVDPMPAAAGTS